MNSVWNSAAWLLIVTGSLLGLTLPFGKLSAEAGVPPALWALLVSAGTGLVLFAALLARGCGSMLTGCAISPSPPRFPMLFRTF